MTAEKRCEPIWRPETHHELNTDAANGLVTYAGTLPHLQSMNTSALRSKNPYNCLVVRIHQNSKFALPPTQDTPVQLNPLNLRHSNTSTQL
jgi:hypothetical protein